MKQPKQTILKYFKSSDRQIQRMRKEQVMCITICNGKFQKAKMLKLTKIPVETLLI